MAKQTQDKLQTLITSFKEKIGKLDAKKSDTADAERSLRKKLRRAQRRLRAMLGKPRPRKIFRTIIRPGGKPAAGAGGPGGQAKK